MSITITAEMIETVARLMYPNQLDRLRNQQQVDVNARWILAVSIPLIEKAVRDRVADEIIAEADEIDTAFASSGLLGELEEETRGMRKAANLVREGGINR